MALARVQKNSKILRGRVGNLVFRVFNGKEVVSIRPSEYKKSTSPNAIKNKNRFSAVVALAKFVNSLPELSKIWETSTLRGNNNYMKILKANLALTEGGNLCDKNIILPSDGFHNPVTDIILNEDKLNLYFSYSKDDLSLLKNKYDLHLIFYKSEIDRKQKLIPGITAQTINDIELSDYLEITLKLSHQYFYEINTDIKIFCILTAKEVVKGKNYSTTFGKTFFIEKNKS
ncbi:MAG: hypothetical protein KF721_14035 [Ignavibacteriaceae bacterium]|nr:hypothetical protein [Ignavibacteriaceae bacterium]